MGASVLNICRWHFGNPGNLDRMFILILFGEESFEANFIVYFVFVMVDCILCQNAFNRLIVNEFWIRLATWLNCCEH
jgi:hypothetical protein